MTDPSPDWVEQARRFLAGSGLADALTSFGAGGPAEPADHAAECRWCPLCSAAAALRGRRPDLVEGLADLLSTAATVLRAHGAASPGDTSAPADPAAEESAAEPASPQPVQRIDVA